MAWKRGVKSLYYCRSMSIARADTVSEQPVRPAEIAPAVVEPELPLAAAAARRRVDYEECLACQ
jgi:ribonucleoside-diphosphate reductase alpha chain